MVPEVEATAIILLRPRRACLPRRSFCAKAGPAGAKILWLRRASHKTATPAGQANLRLASRQGSRNRSTKGRSHTPCGDGARFHLRLAGRGSYRKQDWL